MMTMIVIIIIITVVAIVGFIIDVFPFNDIGTDAMLI
jgi:hypothetical protein